ncbi:MAG: CPBP family intramembrane metalloprotease [Paludibacter sp.]|nr:CPBP family intramembrane metalloprotease [Paludibacter sp.]
MMNKFKGILSESGTISRVLLLVGTSIFFATFGMLLWTVFTNRDLTDVNTIKTLQFVQAIGAFILPPLFLAYLWSNKPLKYLQLDKKTAGLEVVYVLIFMVLIIPAINLLGDLNQQLILPKGLEEIENWMKTSEEQAMIITQQLLNVHTIQGLLLNILLIAILPAFGEELIFRGAFQRILQDWKGAVFAIWVAAFVFSAIHLQFYGFLPRLLMGAFLGYLLLWSGNLWLPVLAHFTNNVLAVIFYYFKNNGYQLPDIDLIGTGNTVWLGIASAAIGVFGIFFLKKQFEKTYVE